MQIIPETNDRYAADEDGNIWSLYNSQRNRRKKIKQLHPHVTTQGYSIITICFGDGNKKYKRVARLVWTTFNGAIPSDKEINHINGNKLDNRLSNLECISRRDNTKHRSLVLGKLIGEYNGRCKLTDKQVLEIKNDYNTGNFSKCALGRKYGVSEAQIRNIVFNRQRQFVTGESSFTEEEWRNRKL